MGAEGDTIKEVQHPFFSSVTRAELERMLLTSFMRQALDESRLARMESGQ